MHPGAGADHYALLPLTKALGAVGYTTLALDPRGVGGSDRPDGGYDISTLARDALAVLDHYGAKDVVLLGQSLGSAVAQEMALSRKEQFAGLVLLATWSRTDAYLSLQFGLSRALVMAHPPEVYGPALLYLIASRPYMNRPEAEVEGLMRGMFVGRRSPSKEILLKHLSAGWNHDTRDRLPSLDLPALVISGEKDLMILPEYGQETAHALPRGEHVLVRGERSSHLFHWELEAETTEVIRTFVQKLSRST